MNTTIIFEDKDIIVCHKKAGTPVQTGRIGRADMVSELKNYLKQPYLGLVHRLDQPVEGVMVFAKNQAAAAFLSSQIEKGQMSKCYYALAMQDKADADKLVQNATGDAIQKAKEVRLTDYLVKDAATNSSKVVSPKEVKKSELIDREIRQNGEVSLFGIKLLTGRHHQIRVQFSHAEMPLLGDYKYGSDASKECSTKRGIKEVALCSYHLEFLHPATKKKVSFKIKPQGSAFDMFSDFFSNN